MRKIIFNFFLMFSIANLATAQTKNLTIAHRGAWDAPKIPENSIASLNKAIALGCKGSEFDVWMTKDSVLVVHHDPDIAGIFIENSNWSELKKIKLSDGKRMPTLKEYLKAGKSHKSTQLILEFKMSKISPERTRLVGEKCVEMVKQLQATSYVDYISFDYEACKRVIELAPDAKVSYVNWKHDREPEQMKADGFYAVDYHFKVFKENPGLIQRFKDQGIKLNTWTVNDPKDMKWFIQQGFDYITTDKAEELIKLTETL